MSDDTNDTVKLNEQIITREQLEEEKSKLKGNEKIIEKRQGEFRKLQRMQE